MFFLSGLIKKRHFEIKNGILPQHIAIIMDGNGRWAAKRGLPRNAGHREGSKNLNRIVHLCSDIGIKYLTVYAFSTENWKRPKSEVDMLMSLLKDYLKKADSELKGKNICIKVIGDIKGLSSEIQKEINRVMEATAKNTGMTLVIALNYGGRDEIVTAAKKIADEVKSGKLRIEDIDEARFEDNLYTAAMPDPDLLIRTSGEQRLSNFLLWQSAYTEFWYTEVLWPDFREEHVLDAIRDYQKRNRRFGGV